MDSKLPTATSTGTSLLLLLLTILPLLLFTLLLLFLPLSLLRNIELTSSPKKWSCKHFAISVSPFLALFGCCDMVQLFIYVSCSVWRARSFHVLLMLHAFVALYLCIRLRLSISILLLLLFY